VGLPSRVRVVGAWDGQPPSLPLGHDVTALGHIITWALGVVDIVRGAGNLTPSFKVSARVSHPAFVFSRRLMVSRVCSGSLAPSDAILDSRCFNRQIGSGV
jgi:hypothetical protein